MNTIVRFIALTLLLGLLAGCSSARPPVAIVEKAIALQLSQVQQNLGEQLYRGTAETPELMIQRVKVLDRQPLDIENQRAYEVQGTYDVTLKFTDHRTTQRRNSFDLYLKPQLDQTWQLLRPLSAPDQSTRWVATPIDPPSASDPTPS
jgi:hypothetical protein